ncbi:hypothetical protein BHE74_00042231, partial [Ensete ventricosum]
RPKCSSYGERGAVIVASRGRCSSAAPAHRATQRSRRRRVLLSLQQCCSCSSHHPLPFSFSPWPVPSPTPFWLSMHTNLSLKESTFQWDMPAKYKLAT